MNRLLVLSILGLAACTQSNSGHDDWQTGARFGPSYRAEFQARAKRGEPGVFPAPSGYTLYSNEQRAMAEAANTGRKYHTGTASSRTGEYITRDSGANAGAYRSNALVAAKEAGNGGTAVTIAGQKMKVSHLDVGTASYAVFKGQRGALGAQVGPSIEAALPQLTGCSKAAGPFVVGNGSKGQIVYALTCS